MRHRDVETPELQGLRALYGGGQIFGVDVQADVDEVEAIFGESGLCIAGLRLWPTGCPIRASSRVLPLIIPSRHDAMLARSGFASAFQHPGGLVSTLRLKACRLSARFGLCLAVSRSQLRPDPSAHNVPLWMEGGFPSLPGRPQTTS